MSNQLKQKTMKTLKIIVAVSLLSLFTSCQKENIQPNTNIISNQQDTTSVVDTIAVVDTTTVIDTIQHYDVKVKVSSPGAGGLSSLWYTINDIPVFVVSANGGTVGSSKEFALSISEGDVLQVYATFKPTYQNTFTCSAAMSIDNEGWIVYDDCSNVGSSQSCQLYFSKQF